MLSAFLRRLIRSTDNRGFVILDSRNVNKADQARAWVTAHAYEILVFYSPVYAPELTPDEYLNGERKLGAAMEVPTRTKPDLAKGARSHFRMPQRRPTHVRGSFHHPRLRYPA